MTLEQDIAALRERQEAIAKQQTRAEPQRPRVSFPKISRSLSAADIERRQQAEQRQTQRRVEELWLASQCPRRHRESMTLRENAQGRWREEYDRLRGLLGTGLIIGLIGNRGTGKTQMAACLMRDAVEGFRGARYTLAGDLIDELHTARSGDSHDLLKVINRLAVVPVLVIDESQERSGTDFEDRQIVRLVDKRYAHGGVDTILISNQSEREFARSVGASVWNRMLETGETVIFDWASYREPRP